MKTNGARFLESLGIEFELREYEVDPNDFSALTVAKKIAMPPEQVFKTLLTTGVPSDAQRAPTSSLGWSTGGPNTYVFAVIPGDAELDFKKLARAAGLRKAEMAAQGRAASHRLHSRRRHRLRRKKNLPRLRR